MLGANYICNPHIYTFIQCPDFSSFDTIGRTDADAPAAAAARVFFVFPPSLNGFFPGLLVLPLCPPVHDDLVPAEGDDVDDEGEAEDAADDAEREVKAVAAVRAGESDGADHAGHPASRCQHAHPEALGERES